MPIILINKKKDFFLLFGILVLHGNIDGDDDDDDLFGINLAVCFLRLRMEMYRREQCI